MRIQPLLMLTVVSLLCTSVLAQEAKIVLRSSVIGNQEQPKVLYIVPWQQAQSLTLNYQPLQSLVEGVFEEVERSEFLREIRYRQNIESAVQAAP